MRILHLNSEKGWRGGEVQLLLLAKGLRSFGHEQWIVGHSGGQLIKHADREGFKTQNLNMSFELDIVSIAKLSAILTRHQIDILHMHTPRAVTIGSLASKLSNVKVNVISRRVDFHLNSNPFRKIKYQWGMDRIVAISEAIRQVLITDGLQPEKIEVIHSGINLDRFDPPPPRNIFRKDLKIHAEVPLVGMIAHFADHKGHRYLIDAVARVIKSLPETRLVLVGNGELRAAIESQVRELGLEKTVIFTGFRSDIANILASLDLFVLSSHLEGLCTSLMDAMAMSIPVVATRTGGIPEVVQDGETGILVPPKNPEALSNAILKLISNHELRRRFGKAGRQRVVEEFGAERMIEKTERLYKDLLNEKTTVRTH